MLSVNKFDFNLVKGYARTTSANRVKAVQNICGGVNAAQCRDNAKNAYNGCINEKAGGIDKGTLELFRMLSTMPEKIYQKFQKAGNEGVEGEKVAGSLIKLLQASALCLKYGVDYDSGYEEGFLKGKSADSTESKEKDEGKSADADSEESVESVDAHVDARADSEEESEAEDEEDENKN